MDLWRVPIPRAIADTIPSHAHPALAQSGLDSVRDCLDPFVLATVRTAEFSLFLRSRQSVYLRRPLARELTDIFLAGNWAVVFPDSICNRPRGRACKWT